MVSQLAGVRASVSAPHSKPKSDRDVHHEDAHSGAGDYHRYGRFMGEGGEHDLDRLTAGLSEVAAKWKARWDLQLR